MQPDASQSMQLLMEGNMRYVRGNCKATSSPVLRAELAGGQSPIAAVIRCSDSRVAPEIVFDQPLGSLFVCGVAGNVATSEIIESVEYAVQSLGCNLIVVMGHTYCGAIAHAVTHKPTRGLFSQIHIPQDSEDAVAFNAEMGINTILTSSQLIESKVQLHEVSIVAGVYDIETGEFELVAQTQLN